MSDFNTVDGLRNWVRTLPPLNAATIPPTPPPVDPPRGGGDDGGMGDERLRKVENDIAVIKSNYATKEDLAKLGTAFHQDMLSLTWRIAGVMGFLVAAVFYIARNVPPG